MQNTAHFARSLRPQKLSDVIGQDFVVSMLQNSIFLGKFFPVYLFYGNRGCGKTTVARIIAKMINCSALETFQKQPRGTQLPCEECPSCLAAKAGAHPDFIEIDAASHTGVDHVRTILESAHYLPLMGRKKIYLIDEAHMLSKAAFNALLKMLEEPPASALFILATTEINKIPVTVRSRAFQGIFNAPPHEIVAQYLKKVATDHSLVLEDAAAGLIVTKADRCVRDALNLLEQLGTLHTTITEQIVVTTFGLPDAASMLEILNAVITQNQADVVTALHNARYLDKNPIQFWMSLSEAFQSIVRTHYKVPAIGVFAAHEHEITQLSSNVSAELLANLNAMFWQAERTFNATNAKHLFIEHFLVSLCSPAFALRAMADRPSTLTQTEQPRTIQKTSTTPPAQPTKVAARPLATAQSERTPQPTAPQEEHTAVAPTPTANSKWDAFLHELQTNNDKIPLGIFKRGAMHFEDTTLVIQIPNYNSFLEEQLSERSDVWRPAAFKHLPDHHSIVIRATPVATKPVPQRPVAAPEAPQLASRALAAGPTTDLILKYFPGKLV